MDTKNNSKVVVLQGVSDAIAYVRKLSIIPEDVNTSDLIKNNNHYDQQNSQYWVDPRSAPGTSSESGRDWVSNWEQKGRKLSVHVLVTGSIHLVGRALDVLESQDTVEK